MNLWLSIADEKALRHPWAPLRSVSENNKSQITDLK
jgi:hypothetical protein